MNRTRRKAAKMFRRKYGEATNPFWMATQHPTAWSPEALEIAMRQMYNDGLRQLAREQYTDPSSKIVANLEYQ